MHSIKLKHVLFGIGINIMFACLVSGKNINIATDNDIVNSNKLSDNPSAGQKDNYFTIGNEIKVLYKLYEQCRLNNKDLVLCLKLKLISTIDKINENKNIEILRGIYLVRDTTEDVNTTSETTDEQRSASSVDDLISEKIFNFIKSRSLSLKLFELDNQTQDDDNAVSSRKKKDKGQSSMWPLMMGAMMMKLKMMGLALLAGKALILAKLALVLSALMALKKLSSHGGGSGGGGHDSYQVVSHGAGTHYRRSLPIGDDLQAQNMAYQAYLADVTELSSPAKTE